MQNNFYSESELNEIGLKSFGKNVLLSRKCSIYSPEKIVIGDNVRIDDFCILSGDITLGSNIHISAFCALYGSKGIVIEDYSGMSPRSIIFSAVDDFSGEYLIGPVHPKDLTNVAGETVVLKKFVQLGANTIVMPGITIETGAVTGAMTFVNKNLAQWTINVGIPVNKTFTRKRTILDKLRNLNIL